MNPRRLAVVLAVSVVAVGCSDRGTEPEPGGGGGVGSVSYAADVQPVWNAQCVGCHGAGGSGGLDLRSPDSRTNLVGAASANWTGELVVPGEPENSVLYLKLTGAPGVGDRMPQGGTLDADALETVRRWIADGAPDN